MPNLNRIRRRVYKL